ncbi:hypothetical protein AB0H77_21670 [Streptomyces sp. NPDC050844]
MSGPDPERPTWTELAERITRSLPELSAEQAPWSAATQPRRAPSRASSPP